MITSHSTEIQQSLQWYDLLEVISIFAHRWKRTNITDKLYGVNYGSSTSVKLDKHLIASQQYLSHTPNNWFVRMYWCPVLTIAYLESERRKNVFKITYQSTILLAILYISLKEIVTCKQLLLTRSSVLRNTTLASKHWIEIPARTKIDGSIQFWCFQKLRRMPPGRRRDQPCEISLIYLKTNIRDTQIYMYQLSCFIAHVWKRAHNSIASHLKNKSSIITGLALTHSLIKTLNVQMRIPVTGPWIRAQLSSFHSVPGIRVTPRMFVSSSHV